MDVAIAGGHGQIALQLAQLLVEDGHRVLGIIRNPDQSGDLESLGVEPVIFDLENADGLAAAIGAVDAVVFAAGAGPGSGAERKLTMDRDGAVKLVRAAIDAGVPRYVIVSSVGAEDPPGGEDTFSVYLRAKAEADAALVASGLRWTIVRPGMLTDDAGDERVRIQTTAVREKVPRDDVAAVLAAVLHRDGSDGATVYVVDGDETVDTALDAALAGGGVKVAGMDPRYDVLDDAARLAHEFIDSLPDRPVGERATLAELREAFDRPLTRDGEDPRGVIADLARDADPGLVASPGPRYFGFVIGGSLPAAVAADWLRPPPGPKNRGAHP